MTPEAQRIAIAEACPGLFVIGKSVFNLPHLYWKQAGKFQGVSVDPLNDLNAMHEAEASLSADDFHSYGLHLAKVCSYSAPWHATAAQRAEAFLRTIGKWEDGK